MSELLSKDHSILERGHMEFRAFDVDADEWQIGDASGPLVHEFYLNRRHTL